MATINFEIRSSKSDKISPITIRFRDSTRFDSRISINYLTCKPSNFKNGKCKDSTYKIDKDSDKTLNILLEELKTEILNKYNIDKSKISDIKQWLNNIIYKQNETSDSTADLKNFIKLFLEHKKSNVEPGTYKTYKVSFLRLLYFLDKNTTGINYTLESIDHKFILDLEQFYDAYNLKPSTINNQLRKIKEMFLYAKEKGFEVNQKALDWKYRKKVSTKEYKNIYLNFDEINIIKNLEIDDKELDTARDWLIISCFTGQRVSDFLRFTKENITSKDDDLFLEFQQQKTRKKMRIYLLKEVREILNKRNGDFPEAMPDDKFNLLIKEICRLAKFNELFEGDKHEKGLRGRKKTDFYPKHELVSSHIGRRSFATNFFGKLDNTDIMYITGHNSLNTFLAYVQKTNEELGDAVAQRFKTIEYDR